jgi:hypothetical protein
MKPLPSRTFEVDIELIEISVIPSPEALDAVAGQPLTKRRLHSMNKTVVSSLLASSEFYCLPDNKLCLDVCTLSLLLDPFIPPALYFTHRLVVPPRPLAHPLPPHL